MVRKKDNEDLKFKVKADLAIFEALQENGKLSEEKIAKKTKIPSTTVHYALERLRKRDFFEIVAVPKLDRFQEEVPMAVVGFNDVDPRVLERVKREYASMEETLMFLHGEKEVLMFLVDSNKDRLTKRLFEIMEMVDSKPSIYIIAPRVEKWDGRLPEKVLEERYGGLADRRLKI